MFCINYESAILSFIKCLLRHNKKPQLQSAIMRKIFPVSCVEHALRGSTNTANFGIDISTRHTFQLLIGKFLVSIFQLINCNRVTSFFSNFNHRISTACSFKLRLKRRIGLHCRKKWSELILWHNPEATDLCYANHPVYAIMKGYRACQTQDLWSLSPLNRYLCWAYLSR